MSTQREADRGRLRAALAQLWADLRTAGAPAAAWSDGAVPRLSGYPIARQPRRHR